MRKIARILLYGFAALGALFSLLLAAGAILDYGDFDRTSGGYDPPYTDYTGEPIDWDETYLTSSGMFAKGRVLHTYVDCSTGMISFDILGLRFDFRELSPRALAIHEPREACELRGFEPAF